MTPRQTQFEELVRLMSLRDLGRRHEAQETDMRLDIIINELMDELYEEHEFVDCIGNPLTCDRPDCCQEISPELYAALMAQSEELPEELLNELADTTTQYTTLDVVLNELFANRGLKAARKGWDNGANQEYIEHAPFVGPVKIYQTSTIKNIDQIGKEKSYFKNVIHTFEPTKDDEQANDWYFL